MNVGTWVVEIVGVTRREVYGKLLTEDHGVTILDPENSRVVFTVRAGAEALVVTPKS